MAFVTHPYSLSDDTAYVEPIYSPSYPIGASNVWSAPCDISYSTCPPSDGTQSYTNTTSMPLYAPAVMPGPGSTPPLFSCGEASLQTSNGKQAEVPFEHLQFPPSPLLDPVSRLHDTFLDQEGCATTRPNQPTFPTPSAMLTELASSARPPPSHVSEPKNDLPRKSHRRPISQPADSMLLDQSGPADGPTFPLKAPQVDTQNDAISSHEKKRHYLECLEYYVTYLHQQIDLIGHVPVKLQRPATSTRGMSSQSIRTLLVHMEHLTGRLNLQMSAEEQHFLHLRQVAEQVQETQRQHTGYPSQI